MTHLPPDLESLAQQHYERYDTARVAAGLPAPVPALASQARRVFACSDYVAHCARRWPALVEESALQALPADQRAQILRQRLLALLPDSGGAEDQLLGPLRRHRNAELTRIAWCDLIGLADLEETLAELSVLAETCLDVMLQRLYAAHCERWGTPRDSGGSPQQMIVLGMGKLGGAELNFSSDIDLIFAFSENGETDAARPCSNIEFFTRLGQRLIRVLSEPTADGFAYRVDMRLRPFGDSGPLVASGDALEHYYLSQGRDWERYAFIKARVVAGDRLAGQALLESLQPFVYRRYLDYGAFSALREMKASIRREQRKRGGVVDLKLGDGGIREIEFIAQAFQLIRGGREPQLQQTSIIRALECLAARGHLPGEVAAGLRQDYAFLRRLENRLQMLNDEQTHVLPRDALAQQRIAWGMDCADWESLRATQRSHSERVATQFAEVFSAPDEADEQGEHGPLPGLWPDELSEERASARLDAAGYADPVAVLERLRSVRGALAYKSLTPTARARFDRLMPAVLQACGESANPQETLFRTLGLMQQIAGRSAYLVLLHEHPQALAQVIRLFSASPWIASFVSQQPILLDELLDPRNLRELPDRDSLSRELQDITQSIEADDLETRLDRIRQFKHTQVLATAAADISGELAADEVSERLTCLAEIIVQDTYQLVWQQLQARHGQPACLLDGEPHAPQLLVVAYGKLGSIELGYGSDLDLVFLHDSRGEQQQTDGGQAIDNTTFFTRFGQKLIHFLATRTAAGVLYEIDTRLRPNGNSGLLVSAFDAFESYQLNEAWTWEHQALVRARPVTGPAALAARFQDVRARVLGRPRPLPALRGEIREMREKMRAEQSASAAASHIKHAEGGITDIEFMVQYLVLAAAADHPELLAHTDNQHLIDSLRALELLGGDDAQLLREAYPEMRAHAHRAALGEAVGETLDQRLTRLQESVAQVWQRVLPPG